MSSIPCASLAFVSEMFQGRQGIHKHHRRKSRSLGATSVALSWPWRVPGVWWFLPGWLCPSFPGRSCSCLLHSALCSLCPSCVPSYTYCVSSAWGLVRHCCPWGSHPELTFSVERAFFCMSNTLHCKPQPCSLWRVMPELLWSIPDAFGHPVCFVGIAWL